MAGSDGRKTVVGIGEVLMDRFEVADGGRVRFEERFGGAPANFACHASRCLGCEGYVASAVGADDRGARILAAIEVQGLKFVGERAAAYPSGVVNVMVVGGKNRYEIVAGVAWDHIRFDEELRSLAAQTDAVCFGTLAQRESESAEAVQAFVQAVPEGAIKVFDANFRRPYYDKAVFECSTEICTMLKISDEEVEILCLLEFYGFGAACSIDEVCGALLARFGNVQAIVVTCGGDGSRFYRRGESVVVQPAAALRKGSAGTTVGAGDSFTGALCAALLAGLGDGEALAFASEVAAFVCSRREATPEYDAELLNRMRAFGVFPK